MIRIINRGVETMLDAGAGLASGALLMARKTDAPGDDGRTAPALSSPESITGKTFLVDQCEAVLNGLYGDYLAKKENSLDLGMDFRHHGKVLPATKDAFARAFPEASGKVCVFIHGLMCTESSWRIGSEKFYGTPGVGFGSRLAKDLGYTPVFVRYNTGRHISENCRRLSHLLSALVEAWPVPVSEITLIGHSMGGLVSRGAAYYAKKDTAPWLSVLRHIVCVGSPHLGAPLEKAANLLGGILRAFNTAGTQAPARVLNRRSAGIKDLRVGYITDEEWRDRDPDALLADHRLNLPLLDSVGNFFIAATLAKDPDHPMGRLIGDILVRVPSASGRHRDPDRSIPFSSAAVFPGMDHLHMANHPDVYQAIREFLSRQ
jgi:pimeloyl-ACP methyl ester carboxylesterase